MLHVSGAPHEKLPWCLSFFFIFYWSSEEGGCSKNIETDSQHLESLWNNREKHSVSYTDKSDFTPQPRVRSGIHSNKSLCRNTVFYSLNTDAEGTSLWGWNHSGDSCLRTLLKSNHIYLQPKINYIVCLRGVHKRSPWAQVPLQMSRWSFGTLDLQLLMGNIRKQQN